MNFKLKELTYYPTYGWKETKTDMAWHFTLWDREFACIKEPNYPIYAVYDVRSGARLVNGGSTRHGAVMALKKQRKKYGDDEFFSALDNEPSLRKQSDDLAEGE